MLALPKRPNKVSPSLQPKTETDPVSETFYFLVIKILDNEQSPEIL
jgi:hypothetical protein